MTTTDPDLQVAIPAITAAQNASASINVSTASLTDLDGLAAVLTTAISALTVVMTAKQGSTLTSDVQIYLYVAGMRGTMAEALLTIGSFTGAATSPTVFGAGLSAHELAVRYTGDIANTYAIMSANGITDPFNIGPGPFVIPAGLYSLANANG